MRTLLSLPPAMAAAFAPATGKHLPEWFAAADPAGAKLGSGGGVAHLLVEAWRAEGATLPLADWLRTGPALAVLSGGQSRRLPAYAVEGKVLMPFPALRWTLGQRIDETLLDFMLPDYQRLLEQAGPDYPVAVCSGDVVLRFGHGLPAVPAGADLACVGMWVPAETATHFGVFFLSRQRPGELAFFRQKPTVEELRGLSRDYYFLVDTGLWLLGHRAVDLLLQQCGWQASTGQFAAGVPTAYELYADLGPALGRHPTVVDGAVAGLRTAVVAAPGAEFYHLGTTRQMIEAVAALQNREPDQLRFGPPPTKPHPEVFVLNADFAFRLRGPRNRWLWVENSRLTPDLQLGEGNVVTGCPRPELVPPLPDNVCLDFVPVGPRGWAVRPYGLDDTFRGAVGQAKTLWLGRPFAEWLAARQLTLADLGLGPTVDLQLAPLFPVLDEAELSAQGVRWLVEPTALSPAEAAAERARYLAAPRHSAMALCEVANIERLRSQRRRHIGQILPRLHAQGEAKPFFRFDLHSVADYYPELLPEAPTATTAAGLISEHMLAAEVRRRRGLDGSGREALAFAVLRDEVLQSVRGLLRSPVPSLLEGQIVWARSPVRLDLAGGWSDTPPYCFLRGGAVLNVGANLNGQPPVQVFLRRCEAPVLGLRSIDLGVGCEIATYDELADYARLGSGFALARAALCLAGFHPHFSAQPLPPTLREFLQELGGGVELSLLAAAPKGSGLGTSSVLGATVLAALSDAFGLGWDRPALSRLTLAVEQLLTTGGGWQDQVGGLYRGIKLVTTTPGYEQSPTLRWLPEQLFDRAGSLPCMRLYYTGHTRVAANILREIVRGLFLNSRPHLTLVDEIRAHAQVAHDALARADYDALAAAIHRSWELNCRLDSGTAPAPVADIFRAVADWTAGAKLLGAGGGGYALFLAKDEVAAARLQRHLTEHPPHPSARFVDFAVSPTGLEVSRS